MKGALLSGRGYRIGSQSILLLLLHPSLQTFRAASLNSAINRGLRKSQNVGFRGKERPQPRNDDFEGETQSRNTGFVRRTADPPVVSTMTRDGARQPFRHERRAAARAGTDAGGFAMRLRMGKRDVKDDREPPPRRSRAARFNDPSHSFGKKSQDRREGIRQPADEDIDHDIEDVRASRLGFDDGNAKGGRRRPVISTAKLRAAESDRTALERNPDGSKLSKSRLAYLEKTSNGPPSPENRIPRPPREPYQFIRRDGDSTRRPRDDWPSPAAKEPQQFDRARESHQFDRPRTPYQFVQGDKESRDNFKDGMRWTEAKKQSSETRDGGPLVRPAFTQTMDNRYPISIDYTTPASEFLYGTSVVEAALLSRRNPRRKLYKLYIYAGENRENADRDAAMERLARKNNVNVVRVDGNNARLMNKMSGGRPHNGYVLESSPLPRLPVTSLGRLTGVGAKEGFSVVIDYQSREEAAVNGTEDFIPVHRNAHGRKPFILFLDSIVDPGNLGGIIRTASFLGITAIAISTRNSASFTPVVLKASAGASENVTLFSVNKPAGFIQDSKVAGWKVYAAVAPSGKGVSGMIPSITTDELDNPLSDDPCILMLGNEGEGLRWNLRSKADVELAIQGSTHAGGVDSLNVSVATGILCNAFLRRAQKGPRRQKQFDETSSPDENGFEENVLKEKLF